MKKVLFLAVVAMCAMACGKKCCDKCCANDTTANDTVEVVEAEAAVEVAE